MNCPMCGEAWNGVACFTCWWKEGKPIPRWWRRCASGGHEVSVLEHERGVEFFCHDCEGGAGKGEVVLAAGEAGDPR